MVYAGLYECNDTVGHVVTYLFHDCDKLLSLLSSRLAVKRISVTQYKLQ